MSKARWKKFLPTIALIAATTGASFPSQADIAALANPEIALAFMEDFPELAQIQGWEGIPFPKVPDNEIGPLLASRKITPVPFRSTFGQPFPNSYLIYTIPCPSNFLADCHFLGVMQALGMPVQKFFGPIAFRYRPGRWDDPMK
ncbi:hypothetical protein [Mitsuaria sp. GD03876]|uniref:hypothetical protein n=1 Tax=Mitsuaria sp. GD03876 TaxID=2975399 RepID=UPI00244D653E|nr:hypothetical protein [Mitsuaria sp. GD03876]MDH0867900.1 hypothetical protein [Mitsuaria sp. GD03876]